LNKDRLNCSSQNERIFLHYLQLIKLNLLNQDVGLYIFCLWSSVWLCLVIVEEKKELLKAKKVFKKPHRGRSEGEKLSV